MSDLKSINDDYVCKIFNREIDHLKDGVTNIKNPFHFFTLSTINKDIPELRTIVLRKVQENPLKIFFNADYRSPKVEQLKKTDYCSLLFYDHKRKIQIRLRARPKIFNKNGITERIWKATPMQSRKCYMGPFKPSLILKEYHPNIPLKYLKKDPDQVDQFKGYENFTYIELDILSLDVLELHHDGHIRFSIDLEKNDINFISP